MSPKASSRACRAKPPRPAPRGAVTLLLALLAACASSGARPQGAIGEPASKATESVAAEAPETGADNTTLLEVGDLLVLPPPGYDDVTEQVSGPSIVLVLAAREPHLGYLPTITFLKAPLPGGSLDDPTICKQTGEGLVAGGTEARGTGGLLKSAEIIDGPVGKTCQIHVVTPEGVALITELHRAGNGLFTLKDLWLMTCNHADGDAAAERICRATLAGFRFREP